MYKRNLLLILLFFLIGSQIFAYDFEINGLFFNKLSGNRVEVTYKSGQTYIGEISIPETITYNGVKYTVTSIGYQAFKDCKKLTGILNIPKTITSIESEAFYNCSGLNGSLIIPNSVTNIESSAFRDCSGLDGSLIIPNSLVSIGDYAFSGCSSLSGSLTIPNSVKLIGKSAFNGCSGFTGSLTLPYSLESISDAAFMLCNRLTGPLIIPNSITKIGASAFRGCSRLTGPIIIPNTVKSIGEYAFNGCVSAEIFISKIESVPSIHNTTFYAISSKARLFVPKGWKENYERNANWKDNFAEILESSQEYRLNVKAVGNGSITFNNISISNQEQQINVINGDYVTILISPESGFRLKRILVDGDDKTSDIINDQFTVSAITKNTSVEVEFEEIPITYTISGTAVGDGEIVINDVSIRNKTQILSLEEGMEVKVNFIPDNGNHIESAKVNETFIPTSLLGDQYVIERINENINIEVAFEKDVNVLTVEGINYQVTSQTSKNVKLMGGSIGQTLIVPATITQNGTTWNVIEIDHNAVMNNSELTAIIWNPEVPFTATVSNPNLLLYVTAEQYAPEAIKNVVVNGVARQISLVDAASGNGFCCPQTFTAQSISYTHRYGMETGVGASKGWETIALPFDVQEITHQTKGTIVPFANWKEGDNTKPFWLYELTGSGFVEASSIQAYKPYIISMPNNPKYNEEWQLNGEVTFKASSVTIGKSDDLATTSFQDRTFIPNLTDKPANEGFFALNVINDYSSNNSGITEGSKFIPNLRSIHPFEAYMSTTSKSRYAIGIFDDMTTDIKKIKLKEEEEESLLFDLQGRKTYVPRKGVYIKNGKKYIKK